MLRRVLLLCLLAVAGCAEGTKSTPLPRQKPSDGPKVSAVVVEKEFAR